LGFIRVSVGGAAISVDDSPGIIDTCASIMPPTLKLLPNSQQRQQFQQIKDKLNQATTDEQLKRSSPPSIPRSLAEN